ncbi:dihydroorotase family protein [Streptomyces sp. NPDC057257]|uniref:dihydroorotase n=1 Tax=Streptomyces sp. NPDC057257 TaxID=3346071 RepID=UPI00362C08AF
MTDSTTAVARYDLLIRGGQAVLPDGARAADIAVCDGRVAAVLPAGAAAHADRTVDAAGRWVLPGLIDSHVHFRTPGLTHKEDWPSGSRAAVAGGVTTVIDMPNTAPPLFGPEELAAKQELVAGTSLVDHRFHIGVDPAWPGRIKTFAGTDAGSAKAFLTGHHTAPHVLDTSGALRELFEAAADSGLLLLFHSEAEEVFRLLDGWQGEPRRWADYEAHRPRTGAIVATARLVDLVAEYRVPAHVLHVSTREEADLLSAAGAAGLPVTFEVTGHHLSFTADDARVLGARIRLSPAIRDRADQDRLWQAVSDGEAATVGSDHAPHALADKLRPAADAPPGLPGVQELLPALYTGLAARHPDTGPAQLLAHVTRVLAERPAQLFGLDDRKGRIVPGADADLVVFDPDALWSLEQADIRSRCGWSAYQGRTLRGRVEHTVRRGETVYRRGADGSEFGPPTGRYLPRRTTHRA